MQALKVLTLTIPLLTVGCASITQGTTQTITFNLEPKEVICQITRDGDGVLGNVTYNNPSITVGKDKDDIVVSCKAAGYKPKVIKMVSSVQTAGVAGSFFLDLGITDMITGAMYKYQDSVTVALDKD
jgi:hypothetical protein